MKMWIIYKKSWRKYKSNLYVVKTYMMILWGSKENISFIYLIHSQKMVVWEEK